ncbi:MAG TPA: ABC transporter ATP-binding protein [Halanaerobiales bacterium]|nr:ABC transporter ATP-binding protein [Halanaerobiales bacterium]
MEIIRKLWVFTKKYRWQFIAGIVFTILNVLTSMIPGEITKRVVDDVITIGNIYLLPGLLLALLVGSLLRSVSIFLERFFTESFSQGVFNDLKQAVYDHLQRLSFNFFNKNKTGELMSRMTGDMEAIRQLTAEGTINLTKMLFYLIVTGTILTNINLKLTIVSLITAPFVAFFAIRFSSRLKPVARRIRKQFSRLNSTVQENITGIRVVKAFHQQDYEMQKFNEENYKFFKNNFKAARVWANYFPLLEFLSGLSTVFLLYFGGRMVINGEIKLGEWIQFNSYLWMMLMPMRLLGHMVDLLNRATVSGERIFKILEEEPEIVNLPDPIFPQMLRGEVEFKNVSLKFEKEYVLRDISIKAKPGETIGIMGPTGSGKSSLINLIGRYYEPTEGEVLIDNINVRKFDLKTLRKNVAPVMQDVFLFSETIRENISYGYSDAPIEEVSEAAELAGARNFIEEMNEQYETVVGEMGMGLSGGQKQRVSLARALLKKAPILILDDATSAVDMETEHRIQEALKSMEVRSTVFLIAHRISSVRYADQIIILKHGRIVERGTHEELLELKGEYFKIYREQYKDILEDTLFRKQVMN